MAPNLGRLNSMLVVFRVVGYLQLLISKSELEALWSQVLFNLLLIHRYRSYRRLGKV